MLQRKDYACETVIVGSGAAAYKAACSLLELGCGGTILITQQRESGTSRGAGSDKQTYYKPDMTEQGDSVLAMAETLLSGGGVDGGIAYAEAANSARCFLYLAELGVPFPTNGMGEFVGYRTDHDTTMRAASAGPYTSKYMTEALERAALSRGLTVHDHTLAIKIVKQDGAAAGLIAVDFTDRDRPAFAVYHCRNIFLATGGPAGVYQNTVYPAGQNGALGLALRAGVQMNNLAQWQFGMASLDPKWNVSGTYQQALPRYISVDGAGSAYDFLNDAFSSPEEMTHMIFRKGYEWPFDVRKKDASSRIDLLVFEQIRQDRRVYLDFTRNPEGISLRQFGALPGEVTDYLCRSGGLADTPFARLQAMNPQAAAFYRARGIDLAAEPLEIGICAQHCNGGAAVDSHWQTQVPGLYCAGEAAGTFGTYRPGGSALNAGQVGALRAAQHIAAKKADPAPREPDFARALADWETLIAQAITGENTTTAADQAAKAAMSGSFSILREVEDMRARLAFFRARVQCFAQENTIESLAQLAPLLMHLDNVWARAAVAESMYHSAVTCGSSGAGLVLHGTAVLEGTGEIGTVQMTQLREGEICCARRPAQPIPPREYWFETVWKEYRESGSHREETGE